jgi:hypothetical protein
MGTKITVGTHATVTCVVWHEHLLNMCVLHGVHLSNPVLLAAAEFLGHSGSNCTHVHKFIAVSVSVSELSIVSCDRSSKEEGGRSLS